MLYCCIYVTSEISYSQPAEAHDPHLLARTGTITNKRRENGDTSTQPDRADTAVSMGGPPRGFLKEAY
jgi:hypothetical protein